MRRHLLKGIAALAIAVPAFIVGCGGAGNSTGPGDDVTGFSPVQSARQALAKLTTGPLSGAIFTTTPDGAVVNANTQYTAKEDVYLDGGPGPRAPQDAAGLPDGEYYFQVTDPSGKDLLSTDHIQCRRINVVDGIISGVIEGTWFKDGKPNDPITCSHNTNDNPIDSPLGVEGHEVVQLFPYDDTPNPGGVYKVWVTRVEDYEGQYPGDDEYAPKNGPAHSRIPENGELWTPANAHGFVPSMSKTDNFKVRLKGKPPCEDPTVITVNKFHDANGNGVLDEGEPGVDEAVDGWLVQLIDGGVIGNAVGTPTTFMVAAAGSYSVLEDEPEGTRNTFILVDGTYQEADGQAEVLVAEDCAGVHAVAFGNVGLGSIIVEKIYDANANGVADLGEGPVEGILVQLSGPVTTSGTTGADGTVTFSGLPPGTYTVTEVVPEGWVPTGDVTVDVVIVSTLGADGVISGSNESVTFTNHCAPVEGIGFGTKGYWHNKNGIEELADLENAGAGVLDYVNGLSIYATPSDWFTDGDEPFDGTFTDGTPVASAYNNEDVAPDAGAGTAYAEISHYLVHPNGSATHEQLGQQLLAFIFNVFARVGSPDDAISLDGVTYVVAQDLIDAAVAAHEAGDIALMIEIAGDLAAFNEASCGVDDPGALCVSAIPGEPCAIVYP